MHSSLPEAYADNKTIRLEDAIHLFFLPGNGYLLLKSPEMFIEVMLVS